MQTFAEENQLKWLVEFCSGLSSQRTMLGKTEKNASIGDMAGRIKSLRSLATAPAETSEDGAFSQTFVASLLKHRDTLFDESEVSVLLERMIAHTKDICQAWYELATNNQDVEAVRAKHIELCGWLADIGDEKMHQRVEFVKELLEFGRGCDECTGKWSAADSRDKQKVSQQWAALVKPLSVIRGSGNRTHRESRPERSLSHGSG